MPYVDTERGEAADDTIRCLEKKQKRLSAGKLF
jgi:hypothetical protein